MPGLIFLLGGGMLTLSCAIFALTEKAYGHLDAYTPAEGEV